jgi:hypothetical protein
MKLTMLTCLASATAVHNRGDVIEIDATTGARYIAAGIAKPFQDPETENKGLIAPKETRAAPSDPAAPKRAPKKAAA